MNTYRTIYLNNPIINIKVD